MIILRNEILIADDEEIIYKTISFEDDLYGMYSSKRGTIVKPGFLHIWEFDGETTVVIDQNEAYWEMDWNGIITELSPNKAEEYKSYIIKNSRCNCFGQENLRRGCQICCGTEQIENAFSDRSFNKFFGWED